MWRPSRRTSLQAHAGRRYGSMSYWGSFSYAPSDRSSFNVSVYDAVTGFGGQVNRALAGMSTDFTANRNPLSGDISGCVASNEGGNCLSGALSSLRSATFRGRGVSASYSADLGRITAGIGAGYDRRRFIAATGTVLAVANGVVDENVWAAAYVNGDLTANSSYRVDVYGNWFKTGSALDSDTSLFGATLSYYHSLTSKLSASAALGINSITRDAPLEDIWTGSALVGVRYSF